MKHPPMCRRRPGRVATSVLLAALAALAGCDRFTGRKPTVTAPPGSILESVGEQLEPKPPTAALAMHLDGFYFLSGALREQHRVQQYCGPVTAELMQCALFDGTGATARLVGVQYVISERAFQTLPDDEKPFWHSQVFPVKAGTLIAPGLSEDTEHALARRLVQTYAKTWRLWAAERDGALPLGVPQLMMGFTRDGQLDPVLLAERDRQVGVVTAEKRRSRADIPEQPVAPGADAWQHGRVAQVRGTVDEPVSPR